MLGPQLGVDPDYNFYPVFRPDYANFYSPIAPQDFAGFTGYTTTESRTWTNMLRAQFTNASLFGLPGGDAGFAIVAEAGNEGWEYNPDPRLIEDPDTLESQVWGTTSVSGGGHRSRYAVTSELRLPLLDPLTVTLSDTFQGLSGYYGRLPDYYRCSLDGYDPANVEDCAYMWIYDAYAKTRTDASVAWSKDRWTTSASARGAGRPPLRSVEEPPFCV